MSPRLRYLVSSFLIGVMGVGLAWAGSAIAPPVGDGQTGPGTGDTAAPDLDPADGASLAAVLESGHVLAGAARASIAPRAAEWGGVWETAGCETVGPDLLSAGPHALDSRVRWLENSNCIYAGGNGIGPLFPFKEFDQEYGLWVRSAAISDGSDTLVMTILDGAYYFGRYNNMCSPSLRPNTPAPGDGCGFFDLSEDLGAELGIPASNFMFASTHAHSAPDFIGAWGGVPLWYMNQVTDALKASVNAAVRSMEPARVEFGEEFARQFGSERRDFYRSAEEYGLSWVRLVADGERTVAPPLDYRCMTDCPDDGQASATAERDMRSQPMPHPTKRPECEKPQGERPKHCPTPSPSGSESPSESPTPGPTESATSEPTESPTLEPTPEPTESPAGSRAIATIGAYAAHPVNMETGTPTAHPDFAGAFEDTLEKRFGGVGLFFQTGLGNISPRSGDTQHPQGEEAHKSEKQGYGLALLIPEIGKARSLNGLADLDVRQRFWNQPVTNVALGGGGLAGIFDRAFEHAPAAVRAGDNSVKPCTSASAVSVRTAVSAARLGPIWITGAPGEIFSNFSNTLKEKNPDPSGVTLPLALVNDGLGYIMQSFEADHGGRQVLGFAGVIVEYEDAYNIDPCFGDMALEATLGLLGHGGVADDQPEGVLRTLP